MAGSSGNIHSRLKKLLKNPLPIVTFFFLMHQTKYRRKNKERSNMMGKSITMDSSKCISCGECTKECQRHLPVFRDDEISSDGVECIGCYHCYAVCPRGAISVDFGDAAALTCERVESEQFLGLLTRRRSCRRFQDRRIEADTLSELIQMAAYVPSGGNSRSYRLTVITDSESRRQLESELERIYHQRKLLLGSVLLRSMSLPFVNPQMRAFIRDRTYLRRVSFLLERFALGEDPIFYHAPVVVFVHSRQLIPTPREDSVLAAYNIVLASETMGLGSCFVSLAQNAINTSRTLKRILGMDKREQVHAVVVLGYPEVRFQRAIPEEPVPVAWAG
jgi:nitroreductase/Pyruvate/2-oxoacid:ferredoxin oxidoreductase delta subunit